MKRLLALPRFLLAPSRPDAFALGLLAIAALGVFVGGLQHARLLHRGYEEVWVVGPLFFLNGIGSMVVVLALLVDRVWVFVLGALSIAVGSLVSIAISHSTIGFFGFREGGYDPDAIVIVAAEVVAAVFALVGAVAMARERPAGRGPVGPLRGALTIGVVGVLGSAVLGIGMGQAAAEGEPAPSAAQIAAARQRLATGDATVRRGREAFTAQGCDRCHSIAAIDAGGKLGPRLDTIDEDAEDNLESITDPRHDTEDGYPEKLMPADYGARLDKAELQALATFVTTVSDGESGDGGASGKGRGRGRGGGDGGED